MGHGDNKEAAAGFEAANPGVFLSGNLLYGVSVGDCIKNATAVSGRVGEFLGKIESGEQTLKIKT